MTDELQKVNVFLSPVEHKAVINCSKKLRSRGIRVETLGSSRGGRIDINTISQSAIYVIQAANSETGVIQNLQELKSAIDSVDALLICDASQALWKLPLEDIIPFADAIILSGHKAYGPKGVGVLLANERFRQLLPHRNRQEQGVSSIREGTPNVPATIGLALAIQLAIRDGESWRSKVLTARTCFERSVLHLFGDSASIHFSDLCRLPNTTSLRMKGVAGDLIVARSKTMAFSYGSACNSGSPEPSQSLIASGVPATEASETVRISFGREQGEEIGQEAAIRLFDEYRHFRIAAGLTQSS